MAESSEAAKSTGFKANWKSEDGGEMFIDITTDRVEVVDRLCTTAITLGALYVANEALKNLIDLVIKIVLGDDATITPGSLHVKLHCSTDERFLEVLTDYKSGKMKERLEEEFLRVGIMVKGLKVEIQNMAEVNEIKEAIHRRNLHKGVKNVAKDDAESNTKKNTEEHFPVERQRSRDHKYLVFLFKYAVAKGLTEVFKGEWNSRYQARFGSWDDTSASGCQLFHLEKIRLYLNQDEYLEKFRLGDTNQWDCPVLLDAILSSCVIGKSHLDPTIRTQVERLRTIRNKIVHSDGVSFHNDFQSVINDVEKIFRALGLPVKDIVLVKNRYKSFKILPLRAPKEVTYRSQKIDAKLDELETLRNRCMGELTYYYISGNPASGKSQLARRLCRDLFRRTNWESGTAFVMTLKAKNAEILLDSYRRFSSRLNCGDTELVTIMSSDQPNEGKIIELRSLITKKIKTWKKWWIIVDNVEDLDMIYPLLPQMGDQGWNNGQIVLTVQNTTSVPDDSFFTKHISIGDGTELRRICSPLLWSTVFSPRLYRFEANNVRPSRSSLGSLSFPFWSLP